MIRIDKDRAIRVAGILAIAWGSGFLMQNTDFFGRQGAVRVTPGMHLPSRAGRPGQVQQPSRAGPQDAPVAPAGQPGAAPQAEPAPPKDAKVPAGFHLFSPADPERFESRLASHFEKPLPQLAPLPGLPQLAAAGCQPELSVRARAGGMISLGLQAPCNGSTRLAVQAGAISFTAMTDRQGRYSADFPALEATPMIRVSLGEGHVLKQRAFVPDAMHGRRLALVWEGPDALDLKLAEPNPALAQAIDARMAAEGAGHGVRTYRLGDPEAQPAHMALIVDLSRQGRGSAGAQFIVEAALNDESCGRPLKAQLLDSAGTAPGEISMILPPCDGQSGYLQLKNFVQDLKIARN